MCKVNKILFSSVSIVDFEQVNVNCVRFQVQKTLMKWTPSVEELRYFLEITYESIKPVCFYED